MRSPARILLLVALAVLALRAWAMVAIDHDRLERRLEFGRSIRERLVAEEMTP